MEAFSALLAICAGNSPVTGEFHTQRPVTRRFDIFSFLRLNKRLNKQRWGWWFETPSSPLWRHGNDQWIYSTTENTRKSTTNTSVKLYVHSQWADKHSYPLVNGHHQILSSHFEIISLEENDGFACPSNWKPTPSSTAVPLPPRCSWSVKCRSSMKITVQHYINAPHINQRILL